MAIAEALLGLDWKALLGLLFAVVVLGHIVAYVVDPHALRAYPGPTLAKFTDLWLGRTVALGHRSEVVHELHQKYGEYLFCYIFLCFSLPKARDPYALDDDEGLLSSRKKLFSSLHIACLMSHFLYVGNLWGIDAFCHRSCGSLLLPMYM